MSTVAQLIDRAYREWLAPADEQPTRFTLAAAISSTSATEFTVDTDLLTSEELELFGPGTIVEIEQEWIQVGTYDEDSNVASDCLRGVGGTTAATHDNGTQGVLRPKYPRKAVFDAVCDSVVGLWPDLYKVTETASLTFSTSTYTEVAATVMQPMYVWARPSGSTSDSSWAKYGVSFLDHFPPSSTGKAITAGMNGSGYLVYKTKFARPSAESVDLIATTGLNEEWEQLVVVSAVAHLVAGKDLSPIEQSFLSEQLAVQQFPAGSASRVRDALLRYQQFLLQRAKAALRSREFTPVVNLNPI